MDKQLRLLLTSALMLFAGQTFAEDIIWSEDWSSVTEFKADPGNINPNYVFTGTVLNDDGTFKSGTAIYDEKLAGGEAPELLVAKSGGSFAAKVSLNGRGGDMVLAFKSNKKLAVTAEGAAIGDVTVMGNDYLCPVTVVAGTSEITIKFTMKQASNARLDNIKLYQGTAKKPAGLSWGKASTSLYLGQEVGLTLSNENNLPVSYTSSDETVATISSDGVIALMAVGKTTLTASFAGNDEYEAQTVAIEVTVKENAGETPEEPQPGDEVKSVSVAEALSIIEGLESGGKTTAEYKVKGFVVEAVDISTEYGNATFTMADEKGGTPVLTFFRGKSFNGANVTDGELVKAGDEVEVQGLLQKYEKNGNITPEIVQGTIISINGKTEGSDTPNPPAEVIKAASIAELLAKGAQGPLSNVELTLTDAKVLYNDGNYIYVRENGAAVCFYKVEAVKELFKNNAVVNGTVILDYELYKLLPEVRANASTRADGLTVAQSEEEAVPVKTTLTAVDEGNNVCDLVTLTAKLRRVYAMKEDGSASSTPTYYLDDEEASIVVVNNNMNLKKLADEAEETGVDKVITVTGIVNTGNNAYQIKLTKNAEDAGAGAKGDVNGDGAVNVADISAVIDVMAGQGTAFKEKADVNGDGSVNVADISSVIDIMAE